VKKKERKLYRGTEENKQFNEKKKGKGHEEERKMTQ